ncbi:type VI secretion system tube protein Hcp [Candidatus Pantoea deserta]|uniref:Type VI secretion system tube protein Hcp n=1 Tax=Candidatus Pantoea deserta TaxID=1869313 RepID=A0A3N4PI99_9GAMM|nr:type VI secretion system tube protein TssD [Pantoea deserta]RPD99283.1 type VI secretion system tube protein Hcp [Pantoea deserta]
MSLPAYLFLYDENGMLISGNNNGDEGVVSKLLEDRRSGIEIMSSQHGIYQPADATTGRLNGTRQHRSYILHKQLDKNSPMLNDAVCTGKVFQQAVIKYYETSDTGMETEVYRVTMGRVVITSTDFSHACVQGSRSPNMLEVIGLRYNSIEWFYIPGIIKYDDSWRRQPKEEDKPGEYK